jgi:uncharacterized protein (DUF58 family)
MKATATYKFLPPELADRLRGLKIAVRRLVEGGKQGMHRSPHFGASVEFMEFREYTPGDPPDLIDWPVFARSDKYVIRRYQEETNLRAFIMLDCSESLAYKDEGLHTKMDYAAYLAAGLMYILINQSDSAGLMLFDGQIRQTFAPSGSFEGLRPMLLSLEAIKPTGRSKIEQAIHAAAEMIKSKSLVIIISDLLDNPAEILRGVRHLHHDGHEVTLMHVLDAGELHLNFTGLAELKELETGSRMVIQADEVKEAYSAEVQRYIDELRRGCMDCMADYYLIDTRKPIEEALHLRAQRA